MGKERKNLLQDEKSPYLNQHADNPVDWHPWGDRAFKKAREEDRPLFISIGYSTCHWCHVMNRESFQDLEVARILNESFVPVKVDREERPDVDMIYMTACQAMTGHGGWPLTVIASPEGEPFFAGTYFPRTPSRGMPGLIDILSRVSELWDTNRDRLLETGGHVSEIIRSHFSSERKGSFSADFTEKAVKALERSFDSTWGGFGPAPKFPTPHRLIFLLRHYRRTGDDRARRMAEKTLESMHRGGIYDHVGFGFCRYATDEKWLIPHFEKMLYDNALLILAYAEAGAVLGREDFSRISREIIEYLGRDLSSPGGGFFSAEDAESEGVEGKFYLWTPEEVEKILGPERGQEFCRAYSIQSPGNFGGASVPNLLEGPVETVLGQKLEESRQEILRARERRPRPFRDEKILTSWNGLAAAALAFSGRLLGREDFVDRALEVLKLADRVLTREDGSLWARYSRGEAAIEAFADDYAFMTWARLEMYRARPDPVHLEGALGLTEILMDRFWDSRRGLALVAEEAGRGLIARPRDLGDGALPSANSVTALNLSLLAQLMKTPELEDLKEAHLRSVGQEVSRAPENHAFYLVALELDRLPPVEIVITGEAGAARPLLEAARRPHLPGAAVIHLPPGELGDRVRSLIPWLGELGLDPGEPAAHICRDRACQLPTGDPEELARALEDLT